MSAKLFGRVYDYELDHSSQSILLALADHGHDDGTNIRPGIERLAWKTGYSERQVRRIINSLVERKVLVQVARAMPRRAREYVMHLEVLARKGDFVPRGLKADILSAKGSTNGSKDGSVDIAMSGLGAPNVRSSDSDVRSYVEIDGLIHRQVDGQWQEVVS